MPAGFRANAVEAVLVHESPRCGDLVIHAGRLRDGLPNDLDSGEILALRMGRTDTLPELQMSATGRLSSGGANRPCNRILGTNAPNLREELDCHTFVSRCTAPSLFKLSVLLRDTVITNCATSL